MPELLITVVIFVLVVIDLVTLTTPLSLNPTLRLVAALIHFAAVIPIYLVFGSLGTPIAVGFVVIGIGHLMTWLILRRHLSK